MTFICLDRQSHKHKASLWFRFGLLYYYLINFHHENRMLFFKQSILVRVLFYADFYNQD